MLKVEESTYLTIWEQRIKERQNDSFKPILVKSYESLEMWIACHPEQLIYTSPGVFWFQMPFSEELMKVKPNEDVDVNTVKLWLDNNCESYRLYLERKLKHDIANQFGANELGRYLCLQNYISEKTLQEIRAQIEDDRKGLDSFKLYNLLRNNTSSTQIVNKRQNCRPKLELRALLLDDEAEIGWALLLGNLVTTLDVVSDFGQIELRFPESDNLICIDYDVIILDLNLKKETPDIEITHRSGYRILERIRAIDYMIPVIILTGSDKAVNETALTDLGAIAYITKPVPGYKFVDEQANKLMQSFKDCEVNKRLRYVWKIFTTLNLVKNIASKFRYFIYKLFTIAFIRSRHIVCFTDNDDRLLLDECLLLLHHIMSVITMVKYEVEFDGNILGKKCRQELRNLDLFLTGLHKLRCDILHEDKHVEDVEDIFKYFLVVYNAIIICSDNVSADKAAVAFLINEHEEKGRRYDRAYNVKSLVDSFGLRRDIRGHVTV